MAEKEGHTPLPEYRELKRRCDFCDREFRSGDLIAACPVRIENMLRPYTMIFCFKGGGDIRDQKCILLWQMKYEGTKKHEIDFEVMVYKGKRRGGGGKAEDPAYIQ